MGLGSTGVTAVAVPTLDAAGQLSGFAANVASRHAFCSVVSREGSALGSDVVTDRTLAWPAPWPMLTSRLAPLALEYLPLVDAANEGLNASAPQPSAWKGVDRLAVAPSDPVRVVSVANTAQFVGLRSKPCRLIETVSDRSRVGMPPTMFGTLGSVTTTCAVSDLTSILARATTGLRLNGPATGCTTIDNPYGPPS